MELISRYIAAAKRNLSAPLREEVAEELTSIIHSACQEQEETLGRALTDQEMITLLNSHGHPQTMAGNYGTKEALIGNDWFPVYKKVLPFCLMLVVAFHLFNGLLTLLAADDVVLVFLLFSVGYQILNSATVVAVIVTGLFYYLDGSALGSRLLDSWYQRALPGMQQSWMYIPLTTSFNRLAFALMILFILNGDLGLSEFLVPAGQSGEFIISASVSALMPWLNVTILAFIGLWVMNLLLSYWRKLNLTLSLLVRALLAVLLLLVLFSDTIVVFTAQELEPLLSATFISDSLDKSIRITIAIFVVAIGYELLTDVRRLMTLRGSGKKAVSD
jgi:succinate dehydrogenase/fumarate reductase cytochrome b subunit